jgi:hypothetical protein
MPDIEVTKFLTVGYKQYVALKYNNLIIIFNIDDIGKANVKFGQKEKLPFLGIIKIDFLLGTIIFYIIKVSTSFLLYL